MALFTQGLLIPDLPVSQNLPQISSVGSVNGTSGGIAFIVKVPRTGKIQHVAYVVFAAIAGTNTYRVSIQGVANGLPNGAIAAFRIDTQPAVGWAETSLLTADGTDSGTQPAFTIGQTIAICFEYTAYTSGSFTIGGLGTSAIPNFPYVDIKSAGTWGKTAGGIAVPNVALKYDAGVYEVPRRAFCMIGGGADSTVLTTGSSPNEAGIMILPPWDYVVDGALIFMRPETTFAVALYTADGTLLEEITGNTKQVASTIPGAADPVLPNAGGGRYYWFSFGQHNVPADVATILAVRPTVAGNLTVWNLPQNSDLILAGTQGGLSGSRAYRSGGLGAFTIDTVKKSVMAIHLAGISP